MKSFLKVLILGTFMASAPAFGALTFCATAGCLGSNDSTGWSQLGGDATVLSGGFSATSGLGIGVTGAFSIVPTDNTGLVADVCPDSPTCSWTTSGTGINAGDTTVWAFDPNAAGGNGAGTGPITLSFGTDLIGGGAWLQADTTGSYTAQIQAVNGGTSLGFFTVTSDGSGDPVFLGALDTTNDISKIVFSLTSCAGCSNLGDFALDTLLMTDQPSSGGVPEPSSLFLLGSGLLGMGWTVRRRSAKSRV